MPSGPSVLFSTCLYTLQHGYRLDENCRNVELHRTGSKSKKHPITAQELVRMLNQQLDTNLDEYCTLLEVCKSSGALSKITCAKYGYTVVGKGTTSYLWKEVSQEDDVYRILRSAQGITVPMFLGKIDLKLVYFVHSVEEIRHMLLMSWGGVNSENCRDRGKWKEAAISRLKDKIQALGIDHGDFRPRNILWNQELKRMFIIDFRKSSLKHGSKLLTAQRRQKSESHSFRHRRPRLGYSDSALKYELQITG